MSQASAPRERALFLGALDLEPHRREAFLRESCGDDATLLAEVLLLLRLHETCDSFLEPLEPTAPRSAPNLPAVPDWSDEIPPVIAGRYEVRSTLGAGRFGRVVRASDALTGHDVAVKVIQSRTPADWRRAQRETAALRILRPPGVVRLLDEGRDGALAYIVMEIVEGTPFPGRGKAYSWRLVESPLRSLLESLSILHATGIVHGDLKPGNVLVRDDDTVVILDFGLASHGVDRVLPSDGEHGGTPGYMAPETLHGVVTVRSDLHALGALALEALTGTPRARRDEDLPRDVPAAVRAQLLRCVALLPEDRPATAVEVLETIAPVREPTAQLPLLGADRLPAILAAIARGRAVISGGPGSGRSRLYRRAVEALAARGWNVIEIVRPPDGRPALSSVLECSASLMCDDAARAADRAAERLAERLRERAVIAVDDADQLDPWSRAVLDDPRLHGPQLLVQAEPGVEGARLAPLAPAELAPLFCGPERIARIPGDAASVLHARTGGVPSRLAAEAERWVRQGLATWQHGRLKMHRTALDRLAPLAAVGASLPPAGVTGIDARIVGAAGTMGAAATADSIARVLGEPGWIVRSRVVDLVAAGVLEEDGALLRATRSVDAASNMTLAELVACHGAAADALVPGAAGRLEHLAAAGRLEEVVAESLARARALEDVGDEERAMAVLLEGLAASRATFGAVQGETVLAELARVAVSAGTVRALRRAAYEAGVELGGGPDRSSLLALLRAALAATEGHPARAIELLDGQPELADPRLELVRWSVRVVSARRVNHALEERTVRDALSWCRRHGIRDAESSGASWLAWLRYGEEDFAEAARLHHEASRCAEGPSRRTASLLAAASSLMEAGDFAAALATARSALEDAVTRRNALLEARAWWLVRATAYRLGEAAGPDIELPEDVALVGLLDLEAATALTEAAIAWRTGLDVTARLLSRRAQGAWKASGRTALGHLAGALHGAAGGEVDDSAARAWLSSPGLDALPGIRLQVAGLLAIAAGGAAGELRAHAAAAAKELPESSWDRRREVLSVHEALGACHGGRPPLGR